MKKRYLYILLFLMLLVPLVHCSPQSEGFSYYVSISLDSDLIDEQLTDFPVLVHLSESCGQNSFNAAPIFEELGDDYNATAYVDSSGNRLYFDPEYWNSSEKEAFVWVKVPLANNVSNSVIYLWFDRFCDGSTYNSPANVWADYVMVQHMNDNPDTSHVMDSTSNDNDGTKKATNQPLETVFGVGKGQSFDGSHYINLGTDKFSQADFASGLSFFATIQFNDNLPFATEQFLIDIEGRMSLGMTTTGRVYIKFYDGAYNTVYSSVLAKDTKYYVWGTWDTSNLKIFVNGTDDSQIADTSNIGTIDTVNRDNMLGSYYTGATLLFNGYMDETGICNIDHSATWVGASYETQRDNLNVFGNIIWGNVASRGEFIAAALVASLILIPLLILIIFAARRKR